jgi:hypothetical protein
MILKEDCLNAGHYQVATGRALFISRYHPGAEIVAFIFYDLDEGV